MPNREYQKSKMLIGELDSARSSPPLQDEWWRVRTEHILNTHIVNGEAATILQVLLGQIVTLPRNQFFDSKPWYQIVEHLVRSKIPTFSLSLFEDYFPLTPDGVLEDIASQFERGQKGFALSAWPELEYVERKKIACNIRINGNFKKMFRNVAIPATQKTDFEFQKDGLQFMLEYLKREWGNVPGLISRSYTQDNPLLWERLKNDGLNPEFEEKLEGRFRKLPGFAKEYVRLLRLIPTEALKFLAEEKRRFNEEYFNEHLVKWLDNRTNLYQAIADFPDPYRKWLRLHIDWHYNKRLAKSTTGSDILSNADRADTNLNVNERIDFADVLEILNENDPIDQEYVGVFSDLSKGQIFLNKVTELLDDKVVQKQIEEVRSVKETAPKNSSQWKETQDAYMEYLGHRIEELVVHTEAKKKMIDFAYSGTKGIMVLKVFLDMVGALPKFGNPDLAPELYQGLDFSGTVDLRSYVVSPVFSKISADFIQNPHEIISGNIQAFLGGKPLVSQRSENLR